MRPILLPYAAEAAGTLAASGGELEDALDRYERAGRLSRGPRTRRQLAFVLRAQGRNEAAQREAKASMAAFEKPGAEHERDKAAALLSDVAGHGRARDAVVQ